MTIRVEERALMLDGEVREGVHNDADDLDCTAVEAVEWRIDETMVTGGLIQDAIFDCAKYTYQAIDNDTGELLALAYQTFGQAGEVRWEEV